VELAHTINVEVAKAGVHWRTSVCMATRKMQSTVRQYGTHAVSMLLL